MEKARSGVPRPGLRSCGCLLMGASGAAAAGHVGVDLAAPGAGLVAAAALDELLEPLRLGLPAVVVDADRGTGLLDEARRRPVDLDHQPGDVVAEAVERHDAGVLGLATHGLPRDALVGVLLRDHGVELAGYAADLGHPVVVRVVEL